MELLVVIGIIGVLAALLLPAVQEARESARRTHCQNNLKQLALGLHNYHDSNNILPPAIQFNPGDPPESSTNYQPNWVILLLPFIEQQGLYNAFDLSVPISHANNRTPRGREVPTLLCPSDPFNRIKFIGNSSAEGDNWARGNYGANGVNGRLNASLPWRDHTRRGVMSFNIAVGFHDITDGLSNTMMIAEIRSGLTELDRRGTWALGTAGASAMFWHGYSGDANGPNVCNERSDDIVGCPTLHSTIGAAEMKKECMTCWSGCNVSWQGTARSKHFGGVFVALCDGAVRFITSDIETSGEFGSYPAVWDRVIASSDGEQIPVGTFR